MVRRRWNDARQRSCKVHEAGGRRRVRDVANLGEMRDAASALSIVRSCSANASVVCECRMLNGLTVVTISSSAHDLKVLCCSP